MVNHAKPICFEILNRLLMVIFLNITILGLFFRGYHGDFFPATIVEIPEGTMSWCGP